MVLNRFIRRFIMPRRDKVNLPFTLVLDLPMDKRLRCKPRLNVV